MRILLVTFSDILPVALTQVLNPELEYCAIVVDEPDIAKKIFKDYPQVTNVIFPFYELKECIENFYYDYLLCVSDVRLMWRIGDDLKNYEIPSEKFLHLSIANQQDNIFLLERALHYYKEHISEFEIFATGISTICAAFDADKFKKKIFNFGRGSQDLYYDYQIAKYILEVCGGGYIKYALIGFAPYSFHYDESRTYKYRQRLFQYLIAFNDLHNFAINAAECRKMFQEKFLNLRLKLDSFNVNDVFGTRSSLKMMNWSTRLIARNTVDAWTNKNYPETVKENVQILEDYLTLCEKNNVRPIMFLPPLSKAYVQYFSRQKLDEFHYLIREAQKKHSSALFLDGWKLENFSDKDFYDVGHLNLNGAAKFSAIFNDFIENLEKG